MARILVVDDSPTLRKVVTGILERHGYEASNAGDGQEALVALQAAEKPVDLVLLDFVMPRMNGFQFCRAIRASERFATLPVVLMSAKSDKIRDQFVQQTGAIDAISKPFDAQALVVAIENALRRVNQGRASQARLPDVEDLDESPESAGGLGLEGASEEEATLRARVAADVAGKLAAALGPVLARIPPSDGEALASALVSGLGDRQVRDALRALRSLDLGERPIALAGDIGIIPIGAALQMLQVESQTGVMLVTNGVSEVTITMRAGLIDMVQSRGAGDEFRLGRFFVEEGLVTPAEIEALMSAPGSSPRVRAADVAETDEPLSGPETLPDGEAPPPAMAASGEVPTPRLLLGDLLVQSKRVTEEQLRAALARQSSELIYEVLRWPKGRFEFRVQPTPVLAQRAQLGLPVASIVMEGFRRVDEWRLVEAGLGSFEAVLVRDAVAIDLVPRDGEGALSRPERRVLDVVDGERTVREIIAASHMSSFDACRILMQLLEARLVRRRHA